MITKRDIFLSIGLALGIATFVLLALITIITPIEASTPPFYQESFETATGYTPSETCNDGYDDYFTRTNGSDISKSYVGKDATYFWAGQDLDGDPCSILPQTITFDSVDISGYANLEFKGLFAEYFDSPGDIDDSDYLLVEYQIDSGPWYNLIQFRNDGTQYNTNFQLDADFNGIGEGTTLTETFQEFSAPITRTGDALILRFTASVNSGDEDFAIDNFRLINNSPVPTISKIVTPTTDVENHGTLTYTIVISNGTTISDTAALFTDTLPISMTFGSWLEQPGGATVNNDELTWSNTLTTGTAITFSFTAVHTGTYEDIITNTAEYSGSVVISDTASATILSPYPKLGITKEGPVASIAGETIVYEVELENQGAVSATNVIITDTLPVSVTYVADSSSWTAYTATVGAHEVITWSIGDVSENITHAFQLTATVNNSVTSGTVITNSIEIYTDAAGDDPANNSDEWLTDIYPTVPIATARAGSDNEIFSLVGQVIVAPGTYNSTEWALQDSSGGIAAYYWPAPSVSLGDRVKLFATRGSYNGQEQMGNTVYHFANLGSGPTVAPHPCTTGNIDAGNCEGWLTVIAGTVSNLSCPADNSFNVDDGSGTVKIYVDSDTGIDVCGMDVANGDTIQVTGFSTQYNTTYQIKPRFPSDVVPYSLNLSKTAPANVAGGELFTYTLTVENYTGSTLNDLVITDTVPTNATFAYTLDSGVEDSGVVSWTVATLDHTKSITVQFAVTATTTGLFVINDDYVAQPPASLPYMGKLCKP